MNPYGYWEYPYNVVDYWAFTEKYKKKKGITSLSHEAALYLQGSTEYQRRRVEIETQQNLLDFIREFVNNEQNNTSFIPANIGINDPTLIQLSARGIRLNMLVFFVVGSQAVITNFFQCIGKVKVSIFLSLSRQLILLLPMAYIFPLFLGLDGVWYSMAASDFGSFSMTIPLLIWYIRKLKAYGK